MRLWLNHTRQVSLREQLSTQITLAILCRELQPGERMPSTRELARRYKIHANTASAAYRQLEEQGWLELRHGSGVYVRQTQPSSAFGTEEVVDDLLGEFLAKARATGASAATIRSRLRRWLNIAPPSQWLLIDPDPELCNILVFELQQALKLPVAFCTPTEIAEILQDSIPVTRPSQEATVRKHLPSGTELITLKIRPVTSSLQHYLQYSEGALIAIVSRWSDFHRIAHTMLIAAGIPPESLLTRDPSRPGWKRGLEATNAVICDASVEPILSSILKKGVPSLPFRLLDPACIAQLQEMEANLIESDATPPDSHPGSHSGL